MMKFEDLLEFSLIDGPEGNGDKDEDDSLDPKTPAPAGLERGKDGEEEDPD